MKVIANSNTIKAQRIQINKRELEKKGKQKWSE